jgi:lipopolysaccharide export system protein LptA
MRFTDTGCAIALALAAASAVAAAPAGDTNSYVTYDAGFSRWLNAPKTVEMSQGVNFQQGDAVLKTEAAVVTLDEQQRARSAKSLAPVHLFDPQNDLTAKRGAIDFTKRVATLADNIVLTVKPAAKAAKPNGGLRSRYKDPATITCESIVYDYKKKVAHVPGALTVHQKDRVVTADSAEYDGNGQVVTLLGHVHGRDKDGNVIETSKLVMVIKEGAESITIPVPTHGKFRVKEEEDEKPASAPATQAASAPAEDSTHATDDPDEGANTETPAAP